MKTTPRDQDVHDDLVHVILWIAGTETGEMPVWEVLWEIRGELKSELSDAGLEPSPELARKIIDDLARHGWVEFFRKGESGTQDEQLEWPEARQELEDGWWTQDEPEGNLYFAATSAGQRELESWKAHRESRGLWYPMPPPRRGERHRDSLASQHE